MFKKILISLIILSSLLFVNNSIFAANSEFGLNDSSVSSHFGSATDIPSLIGRIIQIIMGLSATVMLIMIVWAGVEYMLSRGDAKKQQTATKKITSTAIGIIIIVAAYAISNFIISQIKFLAS